MVENGIGELDQEKYRLMWDNIPPWYKLEIGDWFADRGAIFCMSTYPQHIWDGYYFDGYTMDPERPFESLAKYFMAKNGHVSGRIECQRIQRVIKEWHIDGLVCHVNRGCQVLTKSVYEKMKAAKEAGACAMSFESEMADPRSFVDGQVKTRIEAFLETIDARKSN
jgi:benzoyl-CoA reductase/2-hydroxyglutaryl-CoA dehydratase subunit BcrC/BadD/HgdB